MEESKIGNTFYLVKTGCGSMEPHPYKLKRLILSNRYSSLDKLPISRDFSLQFSRKLNCNDFSDKEADC